MTYVNPPALALVVTGLLLAVILSASHIAAYEFGPAWRAAVLDASGNPAVRQ